MADSSANQTNSNNQAAGGKPIPDEILLPNEDNKFLRIFFVGLYMCAVTGLGMTLSIYYLFIWDSSMPELPKLGKRH